MKYYIKEWSDHSASLIAEDGIVLDVFDNLFDAINACNHECMVEPEFIESHVNYFGHSPLDFESSYLPERLPVQFGID